MSQKLSLRTLLVASFTVLGWGAGHAQIFTTGSLNLDGSNIENSGTLVTAVDFFSPTANDEGGGTPLLNGVQFEGDVFNNTAAGNTTGQVNTNYTIVDGNGIDSGRAGGVPAGSAVLNLVNDGVFHVESSGSPSAPVGGFTLDNLTLGDNYSVQLFFDASDIRSTSITDNGVTSGIITVGPSNGPSFITESFTASAATETLTINNNNASPSVTSAPELSGFVVDNLGVAPEPSTYAMMTLGLALLGFCLRFRRV